MKIAIELNEVFARSMDYYKLLGFAEIEKSEKFSKGNLDLARKQLTAYLAKMFFEADGFFIQRRWQYGTKQTSGFIIRPHPDNLEPCFAKSSLAFKCVLINDKHLEIVGPESYSGPILSDKELCYYGRLCSIERFSFNETDYEGLEFLKALPEMGADLTVPLNKWNKYLDWRQKLAEKKANEAYEYKSFKLRNNGYQIDFCLKNPDVLELIKGRLIGESLRVYTAVTEDVESDYSDYEENRTKQPKAVFEASFRTVKTPLRQHSAKGGGNYSFRRQGSPRGMPEELVVSIVQDDPNDRKKHSVENIPDCGFLRAAMEGELSAIDIQRNGLRRLAEFRSVNPNIRHWLFDIKQARSVSIDPGIDWTPDQQLNEEQLECVSKSLSLEDLLLLWGPPGTGKTTVISEVASQYCRRGQRVLVSSQANLAVDQALDKLPKMPHIRPIRISTSKSMQGLDNRMDMMRWLEAVANQTKKSITSEMDEKWSGLKKEWHAQLRKMQILDISEPCMQHYKKCANVIGATCLETGKLDFISGVQFPASFDISIVDEVSKATPPELLLPALLGRRTMLVGDHRQLPPVFRESTFPEAVENQELGQDEFDKFRDMVTACMFEHFFDMGDPSIKCGLCQQYRMHPQIMAAINQFYADQPLKAGGGEVNLAKSKSHNLTPKSTSGHSWLPEGKHLVWIDSSTNGSQQPAQDEKIGTSRQNMAEAELCVHLLKTILPQNQSVAIISLYRAQIQNIIRLLKYDDDARIKKFIEDKSVNTVDQFQGSERDVIIVSLTRTDDKLTGEFIKDFRRINVAMSRAKKLLIIIGRGKTFDSGMVDVPSVEKGRSEAKPAYREIRKLAEETGIYVRLPTVFQENSDSKEHNIKKFHKQNRNKGNQPLRKHDGEDECGSLTDYFGKAFE